MEAQVGRWGNSLAVRVPAVFARAVRLEEGSTVELNVADGRLIITPIGGGYRLDDLVAGITPENRHAETGWGGPLGNEAW